MLTVESIEILTHERLEITFICCPQCGHPNKLTVRKDEFEDFICGVKSVQDCFPNLLDAQRELFQTGIDGECWKKMAAKWRLEEAEQMDETDDRPHYAVKVRDLPPTEITCKCGEVFSEGDVIGAQLTHMNELNPGPSETEIV